MPDATLVESMFGRIARRYDFLNRVLSGGVDQLWRRRTVAKAVELVGPLAGKRVVDVCCGTGDLTIAFARVGAFAVGADFTHPMLLEALPKGMGAGELPMGYARGDALHLPIAAGVADVASVAFGLRNVADRGRALAEMARVVRPGGVVLVLEFTLPPNRVLRSIYGFYFTRILPRLGGWVSGDPDAYSYLPDSVRTWPAPDRLRDEMALAGLESCGFELLFQGVAALHHGRRPYATAGSASAQGAVR